MATTAPSNSWELWVRELGVTIHRLRVEQDLTQERLAVAAGLSAFTLRKLESGVGNQGTSANPRMRTLAALAEVLGVEVADLLPDWTPRDVAEGR